jgi:hypothetical protein
MSPVADAIFVLASVFGSGLLGLSLRSVLPERHLREDSLGMVRLCKGVIATLAALVLGLLVASAKANYDRVNDEITQAVNASETAEDPSPIAVVREAAACGWQGVFVCEV